MSDIHILPMAAHEYAVTVHEGELTTEHKVRVTEQFLDDLGFLDVDEERLVRESFSFLLEHEPATSISREFDLDEIADHFQDYVPEIQAALA